MFHKLRKWRIWRNLLSGKASREQSVLLFLALKIFFFHFQKKKTRLWKIQAVRNTKGNIKSLVLPMVFLKKLLANQSFWVQKLYMFVILDQLILMVFLKKCSFRAIRPFWSRNWRTVIALFFFSNFEQWKRPGHRPTLY